MALAEELSACKAERIKRLLKLPDLTRQENSPVKILFDQIIKLPRFADFDLVEFPRIVSVEDNFDLLKKIRVFGSHISNPKLFIYEDLYTFHFVCGSGDCPINYYRLQQEKSKCCW